METKQATSKVQVPGTHFFTLSVFFALLMGIIGITFVAPDKSAHAAAFSASDTSPYTLTIENPGNLISQTLVTQLQGVFAYSYPKLVQRFGSSSTATAVTLTVYSANDGSIAYTDPPNTHVYINAVYQNANSNDLGWLTHELTHVVQDYPPGNAGWFAEGMADYSRYYYAPPGANPSWWQIPAPPSASDSYTEGYGPTARFLIWLQQRKSPTVVDQLNTAEHTPQSFLTVFQQIAGGTVDQVWSQYVADPTITQHGTCQAGVQLSYAMNQWSGSFNASLTLQNTGGAPVNGWSLSFTFPNTQQITPGWGGVFFQQGETVTITNADYDSSIPAGAFVNLGFNASWSGTNANPTAFTFNGQPCTMIYS